MFYSTSVASLSLSVIRFFLLHFQVFYYKAQIDKCNDYFEKWNQKFITDNKNKFVISTSYSGCTKYPWAIQLFDNAIDLDLNSLDNNSNVMHKKGKKNATSNVNTFKVVSWCKARITSGANKINN